MPLRCKLIEDEITNYPPSSISLSLFSKIEILSCSHYFFFQIENSILITITFIVENDIIKTLLQCLKTKLYYALGSRGSTWKILENSASTWITHSEFGILIF